MLFGLVWRFSRAYPYGWRLLIGASSVLVFVTNPLFYLTSGKAWNHDLPTLLTLGAVLFMGDEDRRLPGSAALLWAGFLLGLAVGTRLSYLTALAPFIGLVLLKPGAGTWRVRFRGVGFLLAGGTLALLPVAVLFALSPGGFVFGNIVYPQLNTVYREVLGQQEAMAFGSKLVYFVETITMDWQSLLLYVSLGGILLGSLVNRRTRAHLTWRSWFYGALAVFLLAGAFAPTPSWSHYFYAPLPFVVLTLGVALVSWEAARRQPRWLLAALVPLAAGLAMYGPQDLAHLRSLTQPETWVPVRAHRIGEVLASRVPEGPVLTLAPIFPLEGELEIYPAFATGPFTWRTAHLLSPEKQRLYGVVSEENLQPYLAANPPAAILTGFEGDTAGFVPGDPGGLETPLIEYAVEQGYQAIELDALVTGDDLLLWVPPGR